MASSILDLAEQGIVLLDGAMGTELIRRGFSQGGCPELWNVEKPEVVKQIHQSYFEAGADAVLTNSFGGNRLKLASYGLAERCSELNRAAATLANQVKPEGRFVGGSLGPTGKFLKPQGEYSEGEIEEAYAEQALALTEGEADFLLIETQYDLREALCALRAARKASPLPVFVTLTFNRFPRGFFTIMGNSVPQCLAELEKNGVPALGANCTLNSEEMAELVKVMKEATSLPLIAQPNAGKPVISAEGVVSYSQSLEDYLTFIPPMVQNGASYIGGCCGTTPQFIRQMAEIIRV